ncbi:hypothetical protein O3M35_003630 [Rhynocoris fuscipes]|uniref:Uncharacterized protein n=1 Tax=Rhynocoris fuscipes TaxID=488301 RepID=A0AAW1CS91_9HEMI
MDTVICREVWSHGRIVRSVVRLCDRLNNSNQSIYSSPGTQDITASIYLQLLDTPKSGKHHQHIQDSSESSLRVSADLSATTTAAGINRRSSEHIEAGKTARNLERRWQLLYLNCLEQQCAVEQQATRIRHQLDNNDETDEFCRTEDLRPFQVLIESLNNDKNGILRWPVF